MPQRIGGWTVPSCSHSERKRFLVELHGKPIHPNLYPEA